MKRDIRLEDLNERIPAELDENERSHCKTEFFKELALEAHAFYGGKMATLPKAGLFGFNWFNVWYTPGVSAVSTTIRDDGDRSFDLSNRGRLVAIVSDSTRVLGDGDVTPPGGLGVMEGKAFLMKYLGGVDAFSLCVNDRDDRGKADPRRLIDFVRMLEPSVGAVNLEDISQPNCYEVLDALHEACDIPVWHDDAQGTGCVTLAGLLNALKVVGKKLADARIVLLGAGASNTTIARLILSDGADPKSMTLFDSRGALAPSRSDLKEDPRFYRKWELARRTNGDYPSMAEACKGADVLISLSRPGPDVIDPAWIRGMARDPIVFACANPVPEIYPHVAREAGAAVVATGRGDFPNQVNNSIGFPGILKGVLLVRARKITDAMAITAAHAIADFVGDALGPEHIVPSMDESALFPEVAAAVAMAAVDEGLARISPSRDEVLQAARKDIEEAQSLIHHLQNEGFIPPPPPSMIDAAMERAVKRVLDGRASRGIGTSP